jgi:hypothetical protein
MSDPVYSKEGRITNERQLKKEANARALIAGHRLLWSKAVHGKGDKTIIPKDAESAFCTLCGGSIYLDGPDTLEEECPKTLWNRLDEATKTKVTRQMREEGRA